MFSAQNSQVASSAVTYIEDVFNTYLYDGTGSSQTITNGIDLSTKGGLVWFKNRTNVVEHGLVDTARGVTKFLASNSSTAQNTYSNSLTSFDTTGFTIGVDSVGVTNNNDGSLYTAWSFRKQAKFFDIVTYTGTGTARTIAHNLGSVPGCIIVKKTSTTGDWPVYHRSYNNETTPQNYYSRLNLTTAEVALSTIWNNTAPTSSVFSVGTNTVVNASGATYVAYIFAHNAGGFGADGTDNVISCSTFTTDSTGVADVTLGYEPQFLLTKIVDAANDWQVADNMRGMALNTAQAGLSPNSTAAETTGFVINLTPTGFKVASVSGAYRFIYIAIRRGPMKPPTSGTEVFNAISATATASTSRTVGFPIDLSIARTTNTAITTKWNDRLRGLANTNAVGKSPNLDSSNSNGNDSSTYPSIYRVWNKSRVDGTQFDGNDSIFWSFKRAPTCFDIVSYVGTSSTQNITHNLKSVPELIIVKDIDTGVPNWIVYSASLGNTKYLLLNSNANPNTDTATWNSTTPTSSVFTVGATGGSNSANTSGERHIAYLFATCAGVSKVGSYTGDGTVGKTINCGFTAGARFIMIKRTSVAAGNWIVWDTARGIIAGNDPWVVLNDSTVGTSDDTIDPDNSGFIVNQRTQTNVNVSGSTYIFLAFA
jgi:hypothetical protein